MQENVVNSFVDNEIERLYKDLSPYIKQQLIDSSIKFFKKEILFEDLKKVFNTFLNDTSLLNKFYQIFNAKPSTHVIKSQNKDQQTPIHQRRKNSAWNENEDIRLTAAVLQYGARDWRQISQFVGNERSASQCNQRWCRALDPAIKHHPFSPEEDQSLFRAISVLGKGNWCQIAKLIPGRTDLQCRYRYLQLSKRSDRTQHKSHMIKSSNNNSVVSEEQPTYKQVPANTSCSSNEFNYNPNQRFQLPNFLNPETQKQSCENYEVIHKLPIIPALIFIRKKVIN